MADLILRRRHVTVIGHVIIADVEDLVLVLIRFNLVAENSSDFDGEDDGDEADAQETADLEPIPVDRVDQQPAGDADDRRQHLPQGTAGSGAGREMVDEVVDGVFDQVEDSVGELGNGRRNDRSQSRGERRKGGGEASNDGPSLGLWNKKEF